MRERDAGFVAGDSLWALLPLYYSTWGGWSSGGVGTVPGVSCGVVQQVVSILAALRCVSAGLVPGSVGMLASIFGSLPK